jgi:hypothetical protein
VRDGVDHVTPWPAGENVRIDSTDTDGYSYFSCYTANNYAAITNPACTPKDHWDCVTDAAGMCAWMGQQFFLYRKTFDDNDVALPMLLPRPDSLTATAAGQTRSAAVINVTPPTTVHETGVTVNCEAPPPAGVAVDHNNTGYVRQIPVMTVQSVANLGSSTPFSINCTASVMDLDPNTTFDYPTCVNADPRRCDIDFVDTYPPLGTVTFTFRYRGTSVQAAPDQTCQLGPSATPAPPPTYVPPRMPGQIRYFSSCAVPFNFTSPATAWTVVASYNGYRVHHASPNNGPGASFAAPDLQVDIP